ncbi:restriction endonuclease subunit S [Bacteroides ovatus]|uniref:restriction endonuclease subunit S n=2 Tax=Bacteroidaceae TaxID=815 RepID=UPI001C0377DF|nr:restriction endonuclease subunit S [Bacteroides ovatus]MBT9934177.1 restriction endonuclease subunit S [Bacteroides ovatus]
MRFPEFSGEWNKYTINDLATVVGGGTPDTTVKSYWGGDIQWFTPSEIGKNKYVDFSKRTITRDGLDNSSAKLLPLHTILLSSRATVGECSIASNECTTNQGFQSLIAKQCNIDFLYYLIQTKKKDLIRNACGSTFLEISANEIRKIKVAVPVQNEQEQIAKLLSLIDERIATQNKIIEKYESLIKGLNDSLYAQYGDDVLTSFSSLGFSYSGLSGKSAQDFGSGKPFITYLNVYSNNIINEKDFQYVAIKEGEKQNVVEYGDVLFTLSSETPEEVGIGSVYLGNENVYLNSFCFGIHIINTKIAFPPYLSYYVSSTPFRKFIYPYAQGSTRFNLCKVDFEKASIKLPSLENQKRIYSILSHIESKTETEKSLLDLYNSQKQYLLRQMFI